MIQGSDISSGESVFSRLVETLSLKGIQRVKKTQDTEAPSFHIARAGLGTLSRLAAELIQAGRSVVFVVRNREEMIAAQGLVSLFTPELSSGQDSIKAGHFGDWLCLPPSPPRSMNRAGWSSRLSALYALKNGLEVLNADGTASTREVRGAIVSIDNFLLRLPPLDFFAHRTLTLTKAMNLDPELFVEQAVEWGYTRVQMVSNAGEIARRGDIVDIMPPGMDNPLRLDFFGDTLEEIRLFSSTTQRSLGALHQATILPVYPIACDSTNIKSMRERWSTQFQQGTLTENEYSGLKYLLDSRAFTLMPGAVYSDFTYIESWIPHNAVYLLPSDTECSEVLSSSEEAWRSALVDAEFRDMPLRLSVREALDVPSVWNNAPRVSIEPLRMGIEVDGPDLLERDIPSFQSLFATSEQQDRPWQTLISSISKWTSEGKTVVLSFTSVRNRDKFLKIAMQDNLAPLLRYEPALSGKLFTLISPFKGGAELTWGGIIILGEDVLQPNSGKARRSLTGAFKGLEHSDTLKQGELLVHRDYGIARFGGLVRMNAGNAENDYLLLLYAGDDKLYVPVDRLALIQQYKGGSEAAPSLDKLGGAQWQVGKEKARKAIEKIAEDLVEIYAWRKVAKGYRYGPIGEMYREFEASFGFEETPDQAKAIQDMLDDMDKPEPMDRLICGDVGFGKTEVAMRAAFRAASEGRQVALLCPTTVLAEQHYQTFRARLSPFAINVGLLSRFVSASKQKEVLKATEEGRIDVLIGTHRLLSSDVHLPHLGLLILDEEQRFGVRHKEKLKQLKKSVDALTLTATPIPRTLQLSISGVRELSVIETAPPERKPVSTALIERNDSTLKQILERELAREGQVFWVHNRVQDLAVVMDYVQKLVPNARVGMAHGQMPEKELETTMHNFWHGELDILVCTAIVESGLDFPRANTLIVDQPQLFGLGQLYQLRGRVGRSDRQAYAVFVVSNLQALPKTVQERLKIILDMDYLGAGFQVALEDLRLRGAGNILGEAQSGQMGRVGIELYLEMLEEAVNRLKGEGGIHTEETEINLGVAAHIPETYISDANERLRWYRRLSSARDADIRHELEMELLDRYGKLPEELNIFIAMLSLKAFLSKLQAVKADIFAERVRIVWNGKQTAFPVERFVAFLTAHTKTMRFMPPSSLECTLDEALSIPERFYALRRELSALLDEGK